MGSSMTKRTSISYRRAGRLLPSTLTFTSKTVLNNFPVHGFSVTLNHARAGAGPIHPDKTKCHSWYTQRVPIFTTRILSPKGDLTDTDIAGMTLKDFQAHLKSHGA